MEFLWEFFKNFDQNTSGIMLGIQFGLGLTGTLGLSEALYKQVFNLGRDRQDGTDGRRWIQKPECGYIRHYVSRYSIWDGTGRTNERTNERRWIQKPECGYLGLKKSNLRHHNFLLRFPDLQKVSFAGYSWYII